VVCENHNLKSHKYVCIITNPNPNPNPNPTKLHTIVNIQLNIIVTRPT